MVDIATQKDFRGVGLDEVGISDLLLPIKVKDRATMTNQSTIGTFDVYVSLADDIKGTHMSRIMEAIYNYADAISQAGLLQMAVNLREKLGASASRVKVAFPYAVNRLSPVSKLENRMVFPSWFEAACNDDLTFQLGIEVDVMTVCPCAKEECANGNSHVQRGTISIGVRPKLGAWIWLEELIEIAEQSGSSPIYDRLKRPDEKQVVLNGFNNPKFVEDIVRDCVVLLKQRNDIEGYKVSCKNYESIHRSNCQATKYFNWRE
jgi:GTP cyclohydrolase I